MAKSKSLQKKALDALSKADAFEAKGDIVNATKWRDEYNKFKKQYQDAVREEEAAGKRTSTLSALNTAKQELADAQEKASQGIPGSVVLLREKQEKVNKLQQEAGNLPKVTTVPKVDTTIGPKAVTKTAEPAPSKTSTEGAKFEQVGAMPIMPTGGGTARAGATFDLAKVRMGEEASMGATVPSLGGKVTGGKLDSAIAKAIELYQMPDIIFNNVPELKKILDRYLDPIKPITLDQFVKEVGNSVWYRQNSKTIQNRYLQKFNYDDLKKSGQDTSNTQYEQDIKAITNSVIAKARELGAMEYADPTAAQLIAEDLYIHNMEKDVTALTKRLAGAIRLAPLGTTGIKGYTGTAQANYQALLSLAKNNGLNLRNILPSRIVGATDEELTNNVLKGLADGSLDYSTIEQTARVLASQGQPQYIKDLLAQGYDLAAIYAPYKKVMADTLEIDPNQIELTDPTLRMAITPAGDMNTYDYQKMLRKDNRWQYTQQARGEVATGVKQVLQDFGFMG